MDEKRSRWSLLEYTCEQCGFEWYVHWEASAPTSRFVILTCPSCESGNQEPREWIDDEEAALLRIARLP